MHPCTSKKDFVRPSVDLSVCHASTTIGQNREYFLYHSNDHLYPLIHLLLFKILDASFSNRTFLLRLSVELYYQTGI